MGFYNILCWLGSRQARSALVCAQLNHICALKSEPGCYLCGVFHNALHLNLAPHLEAEILLF